MFIRNPVNVLKGRKLVLLCSQIGRCRILFWITTYHCHFSLKTLFLSHAGPRVTEGNIPVDSDWIAIPDIYYPKMFAAIAQSRRRNINTIPQHSPGSHIRRVIINSSQQHTPVTRSISESVSGPGPSPANIFNNKIKILRALILNQSGWHKINAIWLITPVTIFINKSIDAMTAQWKNVATKEYDHFYPCSESRLYKCTALHRYQITESK